MTKETGRECGKRKQNNQKQWCQDTGYCHSPVFVFMYPKRWTVSKKSYSSSTLFISPRSRLLFFPSLSMLSLLRTLPSLAVP